MPDNYITLSQLTKATKGLVNKINAESTVTNSKIGDLASLNTTTKTDLVAAINEAASSGGTTYDDTALAGRVTALENAGYITSYTETDPTVPAWAKAASKPTYTAAEVGALPDTTIIPEDKIFPVNVTLTSMTEGTSDKSQTEILAAVNAGKIPFVYIDYLGSKIIASLLFANSNRVSFVYDNQVDEGFGSYAFLQIKNSNVIIIWKDKYITQNDLPTLSSVATSGSYNDLSDTPTIPEVPNWALAASKPTYTAAEVGALPSTYTAPVTSVNGQTGEVNLTIPAAQVQSDWNATSGMGVILNKPTIPAATTVTNTLASGTLIATINGTNIYAPAYTDADEVSY